MLTGELVARAGAAAAVERRLFEVLGGWVAAVEEPEVKVALRVASFRHAAHADLFDNLVGPGGPGTTAAGDEAAAGAAGGENPLLGTLLVAETTPQRLAALHGAVLPALIEGYERWLAAAVADAAAGGPAARALTLVLADDRAELAAGRALLERIEQREPAEGHQSH